MHDDNRFELTRTVLREPLLERFRGGAASPRARHVFDDHPETFGVPPAMEKHLKVQAVLDHGNDDAIRAAITAAYHLQRRS